MAKTNKQEGKKTLKQLEESVNKSGQHKKSFAIIFSELRAAFQRDATNARACRYAGINPDTYYRWRNESDEFALLTDESKDHLFIESGAALKYAIENKDYKAAIEFLKRRDKKRYSERQEVTGADGEEIKTTIEIRNIDDVKKLTDEELNNYLQKQLREATK